MEVNYDGEWGTVCDDGWNTEETRVVCRQLGFGPKSIPIFGSTLFGQGSGPILLDGLACTGGESMLSSCGHLGFGVTRSFTHSEDAGVICFPPGN